MEDKKKENKNKFLKWLSEKWWTGVAAIFAIVAVVVAIILSRNKASVTFHGDYYQQNIYQKNDVEQEKDDKTLQRKDIQQTDTLKAIEEKRKNEIVEKEKIAVNSNKRYEESGMAVKSDSLRAWNTAYARAQNNLLEKLSIEEKASAKKYMNIDYSKSKKPIFTPDGWKATVVVFVAERDLKR